MPLPTNFYETSEFYQKVSKNGLIKGYYEAMRKTTGDLSEIVLTALEVLKKANAIPRLKAEIKSEAYSTAFRNEGNKEYKLGKYVWALTYYNKALLHAPANSQAMTLAYSNRSALLFKIKAYSACIDDIDTCFKIGCPLNIQEKLSKRKVESMNHLWEEPLITSIPDDFFRLFKRNPHIPCASTAVDIVTESGLPKVVAALDIKVGTIVAVEPLFVSVLNPANEYLSCYYCNKMPMNLIPCPKCCFALFCDNNCKTKCMKGFHSVECEIIKVHQHICCGPLPRLVFKAVLKMKQKCKTWNEFVTASRSVGMERMKKSSVREIFDSHNKFSVLSFVEFRDAKFGAMFNNGFVCAALLHYLSQVRMFFPQPPSERHEAMSAVARVMMQMLLFSCNKLEISNVADDRMNEDIKQLVPNYACVSFAGKLRHCCEANLQLIGLNNKVALIAVQPIKKGTELTISYVDHAYEHSYEPLSSTRERAVQLYRFHHTCRCRICDGTYSYQSPDLTDEQKRCYEEWKRVYDDASDHHQAEHVYQMTANTLGTLHGKAHTPEHRTVFVEFQKMLSYFQYGLTKNIGPAQ